MVVPGVFRRPDIDSATVGKRDGQSNGQQEERHVADICARRRFLVNAPLRLR